LLTGSLDIRPPLPSDTPVDEPVSEGVDAKKIYHNNATQDSSENIVSKL